MAQVKSHSKRIACARCIYWAAETWRRGGLLHSSVLAQPHAAPKLIHIPGLVIPDIAAALLNLVKVQGLGVGVGWVRWPLFHENYLETNTQDTEAQLHGMYCSSYPYSYTPLCGLCQLKGGWSVRLCGGAVRAPHLHLCEMCGQEREERRGEEAAPLNRPALPITSYMSALDCVLMFPQTCDWAPLSPATTDICQFICIKDFSPHPCHNPFF